MIMIFCDLLRQSRAQDHHRQIILGQISETYENKDKETTYFTLTIKETLDQTEDLVLKAFSPPNLPFGDPDIYISKTIENPSSQNTSDFQCSTFGKDICVIPSASLKESKRWFVGIRCYQSCHFRVLAQLKTAIELEDAKEYQQDFGTEDTQLFKMWIPQSGSDGVGDGVSAVIIESAPVLQSRKGENGMLMTAHTRNRRATSAGKRAVQGWRNGQSLRLSELKDEWCTECWLHIMVDVQNAGLYRIVAKTNQGITRIKTGIKIDDTAFYGDKKVCYKYSIDSDKDDVVIKLAQYSGFINFSFNPRVIPENFKDSQFQSKDQLNSVMIIQANQRKSQLYGLYYLCVYPLVTSSYSIVIQELPNDRLFELLEDSYVEHSDLQGSRQKYFLYKVPLLDYKSEDIKVTFKLSTLSGYSPLLKARFINQDIEKVTKDQQSLMAQVIAPDSLYQNATYGDRDLNVVIDHNETQCYEKFKGTNCYYLVVVSGTRFQSSNLDSASYTQFTLTATHSQINHNILQENNLLLDSIEMNTYKYYSFTLPEVKDDVANITFQLDSLHGDADLYVSKNDRFPTKLDYEKRSVKSLAYVSDEVVYTQSAQGDGNNLDGTYYLGVYSNQYSSFSILVQVYRKPQNTQNKDIPLHFQAVSLIEGIPSKADLRDAEKTLFFKFDVKFSPGYEKSIRVNIIPESGNWNKAFVKVGSPPIVENDYTWESWDGQIDIKSNDKGFLRDGTYWIRIIATSGYSGQTINKNFKFQISYQTQDNFAYLRSGLKFQFKTKSLHSQQLRHYITENSEKEISISLTGFSGNPQLFVSANPSVKIPNRLSHDFTTYSPKNTTTGKSNVIIISSEKLHHLNPFCAQDSFETTNEPCALFAAVYCFSTEDCSYNLLLQYASNQTLLQPLKFGVPTHSFIQGAQINYYYLIVSDSHNQSSQKGDIRAILTSDTKKEAGGETIEFVIGLQDNPQKVQNSDGTDQWILPNDKSEYFRKSTRHQGQNEIVIKQTELADCFNRFDNKKLNITTKKRTCGLIFGVYNQISKQKNENFLTEYKFMVFENMVHLQSHSPFSSSVEKGNFNYYHIEATCDNCTLMISLQKFSSGDPDLYINYGDQKLPTKTTFDFQSSTFRSDLVYINLKHPFFSEQNLTSIRGSYIVGVYGTKKSNYTITFTQDKYYLGVIFDQKSVKGSIQPYEIVYFLWYNSQRNKDLRVQISVKSGYADLYVNTYDEGNITDGNNLAVRLPTSKRDSIWLLDSVRPTSSVLSQTLVILNQQEDYCSDCFYLLGVVSHELATDFTLSVQFYDADFRNSQLMKIGELYRAVLSAREKRVYKFILDENADIMISQSATNEVSVVAQLKFQENGPTILQLQNTETLILRHSDSKKFKLETLYFLEITNGDLPCEYSIQVSQERTIYHLTDGQTLTLSYLGPQDLNKFMVINLPGPLANQDINNVTVNVYVKSLTQNFAPQLLLKHNYDLDSQISTLEFPPEGLSSAFEECFNWDFRLQVLYCTYSYQTIYKTEGLALNLFVPPLMRNFARESQTASSEFMPKVQITVSTTSIMNFNLGQTMTGELMHENTLQVYSVEDSLVSSKSGFFMVEFSECRGETEIKFIDDFHAKQKKPIPVYSKHSQFGRAYIFLELPQKSLMIQTQPRVYPDQMEQTTMIDDDALPFSTFIIKASYNQDSKVKNNQYSLDDNGRIKYSIDGKNQLKLNWGNAHYSDIKGIYREFPQIEYIVLMTLDPKANLESQCAIALSSTDYHRLHNFHSANTSYTYSPLEQDEVYYINVFAKVRLPNAFEFDYIPYRSISIDTRIQPNAPGRVLVIAMGFIILVLAILIWYLRNKTEKIERRIEFEMTEVRNGGLDNSRTEIVQAHKFNEEKEDQEIDL